jgi:PPOX class probable F420-dependent enzyme
MADLHLLDRPVTAVLTTIGPDAAPHAAPVWFVRDGDDIVVSTFDGTQKHRNVERDPRVSFTVIDPTNEMNYLELRGDVTIEADPDKRWPDIVVRKHGFDDAAAFDRADRDRIVLRLRPQRRLGRGVLPDISTA